MVVVLPLLRAALAPVAVRAVGARFGIGIDRLPGDPILETTPREGIVVVEVVYPETQLLPVAQQQVRELGSPFLQALQQVGIHAKLDEVARARLLRELGIQHLVAVVPEHGRTGTPDQEIGVAAPGFPVEHGLVDDVHAGRHGRPGGVRPLRYRAGPVDFRDASALVPQPFQVGALVRQPLFLQQPHGRVGLGLIEVLGQTPDVEPGRVPAAQVVDQVRGREEALAVFGTLHVHSRFASPGCESGRIEKNGTRPATRSRYGGSP